MPDSGTLMISVGGYLPQRVVSNHDLAAVVDTSDEWIRQRTGIAQRHIVAEGEKTSDLARHAADRALANAGMTGADIDLIIIATSTPDDTFPSTATKVQHQIGAHNAIAFDVQAVCAGFVYALDVADAMLSSGRARRALVIGAESFSKILDWEDRSTCVLFGDGAGAVLLERSESPDGFGVLASRLHADGAHRDILYVDGGPSSSGTVGHLRMEGNKVFRHAVEKLSSVMDEVLEAAGMVVDQVDWLVPHQANIRIIEGMQKKMGLGDDRVVKTVHDHANTSAASIPLALSSAVEDGRIKNGQVLAFEAIGGGLVWGASLVRFGRPAGQ
ncbi:MAG: beta-ketoacyl-ACP synthase III [Pseudomonadota bacterium]|nr:beta-ketoacyl-ACP synthase III [Pseudomonadota bacterium]MEC7093305.1 beta-ketoacyl-ACP synthase III [Pseudomonadota bacterium]MEC7853067.1 beta-ketoacyl-ACP synthase III [Pseudomonadota bacterium]MEC8270620.1 beta-ketoacyl-ACP synthase III [Pseudomonadota bacterium]MEC8516379.1 beta-ketoacyl-ACP synthase III [Pseudomonadota bacterium]